MRTQDLSDYLKDQKHNILLRWESETRSSMPEARDVPHPILIDTLPALLDNLADALSPVNKIEELGSIDNTIALEHGGERARLTGFKLSTVINELRILRKVLIETLNQSGKNPDERCLELVHIFIDEAIQSSATAFSLVQAEIREQVIAVLTHDMRSPLAAASLAADMIIRKSSDESVKNQAKKIKSNNRKVDNLIQDLLNTTLLKSGGKLSPQAEEMTSDEILNDLRDALTPPQLEWFETESVSIVGFWDRGLLRRAFENLVLNAFKYGAPETKVKFSITADHQRVIFRVHNFGPHIPKEEQESIFQIFRRAEAARSGKRGGWGIGLPLVRAVAEAHGGSLSVNSFEDQGTTFLLDVPQDARPFLNGRAQTPHS